MIYQARKTKSCLLMCVVLNVYLELSISKQLLETFCIDLRSVVGNPLQKLLIIKIISYYHFFTCLRLNGLSVVVMTSTSTGGGSNTLPEILSTDNLTQYDDLFFFAYLVEAFQSCIL